MLIGQCWGEGVNVWEVARCYKKCFMLRRKIVAVGGWDAAEQPLMAGICWSLEGQLYSIDCKANLYGVSIIFIVTIPTLRLGAFRLAGLEDIGDAYV